MAELPPLDLPDDPKLVQNITHFARALRRAGLPIGPARVISAIKAVEAVTVTQIKDAFQRRINPEGMVTVVVGAAE